MRQKCKRIVWAIITMLIPLLVLGALFDFWDIFKDEEVLHDEGYEIRENEVVYWSCVLHCFSTRIGRADPESFIIISPYSYGMDKNYIYYHEDKIEDGDPQSFRMTDDGWMFYAGEFMYKNGKIFYRNGEALN